MNRRALLGWLAATPVSAKLARWWAPQPMDLGPIVAGRREVFVIDRLCPDGRWYDSFQGVMQERDWWLTGATMWFMSEGPGSTVIWPNRRGGMIGCIMFSGPEYPVPKWALTRPAH